MPADFLDRQPRLSVQARACAVDWLIHMHQRLGMEEASLWLAVHLFDRTLTLGRPFRNRARLPLLAMAALLLAGKYQEMYPPDLLDVVHVADEDFTARQLRRMERTVLVAVDHRLGCPTQDTFLQSYEPQWFLRQLARYLCELTLTEQDTRRYLPSEMAASACVVARVIMDGGAGGQGQEAITIASTTPALHHSGYTCHELAPCIAFLQTTLGASTTRAWRATLEKYRKARYLKLAKDPKVRAAAKRWAGLVV